jgi:RNA polymerase sigma factor (sigma-70 family)
MGTSSLKMVSQDMQTLFGVGVVGSLSDGQLLERFAARRDEAAFEILVQRHGPMVLGVCRRILRNDHDAEDAFQTTFLVLARKAASIARREMVANWLYAVAHQRARKSRAIAFQRRMRERQVIPMPESEVAQHDRWDDLLPLLDEELGGLPERYRVPIILCDLEGKTRREVAEQLGWPIGTVSGRLSRGRALLAERLSRRHRRLSGVSLATFLSRNSAPSSVSSSLVSSTVKAASVFGARQAAAGVISSQVVALAEVMMRIAMLKKLPIFLMTWMLALGGGLSTYLALATGQPKVSQAAPSDGPSRPAGPDVPTQRHRAQAKSALDRALRDVEAVEDLVQRCWLLDEIVRTQARAGLWNDLNATQQRAVQAANETEHSHRVIEAARCLAETGAVKAALESAQTLRDVNQRERALAEIASAQARAGDFSGAMQTTSTIRGSSDQGIALWGIAKAQAEHRNFEGALRTVQTMGDSDYRASALAEIAARQLRAKDPSFARTLKLAREAAGRNHHALAEVAGILAESKAIEDAQQVAQSINDATWRDIAWKNIGEAQANHGEITEALKTTHHIQNEIDKGESLKNVVVARVRANDFPKAIELAETIREGQWRIQARLEIAKGQARAGQRSAAKRTFTDALSEVGRLKDNPRYGHVQQGALASLAKAQAEVGEEDAALAWIDKQASPQIKAWCLLLLA